MKRFRSWWQQIKQHRVAIGVVGMVLVVVITLIIVGYLFDWTGFSGYNKVSTLHTISGPSAGTVTRTEEYQPGKTLWDWLQLLIIPAVLAVAGYVINLTISRGEQAATEQRAQSEREAAEKRATTERKIALDNQREAALKDYIDKMSELILHEQLADELPSDPQVESIARARTVTVLRRLDQDRRGSLIRFLSQAGILAKCIEDKLVGIDLRGADLGDVNFSGLNLREADLSEANLKRAWFQGARLSKAKLSKANLWLAYISGADLSEANLSEAKLFGAHLSGAKLIRADLSGALLTFANLSGADLSEANLSGARLWKADLSGANLSRSTLSEKVVANLSKADLSGANLEEANLQEADFSGANLKEARVAIEELETKAKSLKGTIMPNGSMYPHSSGAKLSGADLSGFSLSRVDLSNADLSGADLSGANLTHTNLSGADLSKADLTGARVSQGRLGGGAKVSQM